MPSCSPSGSTRRTSRARIRSLMRVSLVVTVAAIRLHSSVFGPRTSRALHQGAEPPPNIPTTSASGSSTRRTPPYFLVAGWEPPSSGRRFLVYQCFRLPVVSSLWTPDGERQVPRAAPAGGGGSSDHAGSGGSPGGPGGGSPGADEPDQAELARQIEAMRAELVDTPVEVVVANHCYGLFELAAVYLSQQPALLPQARLAIDALGCLVGGLEGRLGETEQQLQDGLSQLRLAYVQIDGAQRAGAEAVSAAGVNGGLAGDEDQGSDGGRTEADG